MSKAELVKKMLKRVKGKSKKSIVINVHTHLWNFDCMPRVFQKRYEGVTRSFDIVIPLLGILKKFCKEDSFADKLRNFLQICKTKTIRDLVGVLFVDSDNLDSNEKIVFTPLMLDMEYAVKDHKDIKDSKNTKYISFNKQIKITSDIMLEHPGIFLPFIGADPRRIRDFRNEKKANDAQGIKYITTALEKKGFWGVKIYPTLGFYPDNPYLLPLYDYCEEKAIPITAHCSYGGLYSAQDNKKNLHKERANPENWESVLEKHPNLKLNLGHFGGDLVSGKDKKQKTRHDTISWHRKIIKYFEKYPNVYSDISYHEAMFKYSNKYFNQLKEYAKNDIIWKKILYGTDWWTNRILCKEWVYLDKFRSLSEEHRIRNDDISCILNSNAVEFLGLNNPTSGPFFNHINFLASRGAMLPAWFKF